ncbi:MAG: hypothetical protein NC926_00945, partial [Candidatus Omnitrophica bacterium]|nr:hypothetical protein [Candidatus Omnitrophota bacterium]
PISILNFIPFLNNVRCPCRFSLMIMLFLPILIGFYIKEYISKKLSRIQYFLFNLALFFILFIEYLPSPYQVKKFEETPGVYFYLQNCKEGTLLEIPFGIEDAFTSLGKNLRDQMFYQTIHKKNILGGYISRLNTKIFNLFQKDEFISTLFNICNNSMPNKNFSKEKVENFIKNYKIKYIVVYPECKTKKTQIFIVRTFENFISKKINYENYLLIYLKSLE